MWRRQPFVLYYVGVWQWLQFKECEHCNNGGIHQPGKWLFFKCLVTWNNGRFCPSLYVHDHLSSPTPDQAMQFALLWVAGESTAVLCAPNDAGQVEVFLCCQACQNFCHPACIDTLPEVMQVVWALCAVLSGTVPHNKCKDCTNNAN